MNAVIKHICECLYKDAPEYDMVTEGDKSEYRIKKIAFYNGCVDNRSDRYRVYNIVNALRERNIAVDIYKASSSKYLLKNVDYDLVIIFREDRYQLLQWKKILKHLRKRNIPIIYDTDDNIIQNDDYRSTKNVLNIINYVDAITVTTDSLADVFRKKTGKKVFVIKNTISEEQMFLVKKITRITEVDEKVKIVYQSGTSTHNKDFTIVEKALIAIMKKYPNVELNIFGPLQLGEEFEEIMSRIKFYPYMDYRLLQIYVSDMDINIAPLQINEFNNCKSELKIFEAALLGIPTICSPIDPYSAIIEQGKNGYIARTQEDWENVLTILIEDAQLRKKVGNRAKEDFVEKFYIQNEMENVLSVYETIVNK